MASEELKYFFSYSREDTEFVLKLAKELRNSGANLWLDQLDILGGERWDAAVENALMSCQGMIAILSPDSVNSQNVMDEVSFALEEGKLVVPVLYRACSIPFRLRRVQYLDFTTDYDAGFADLLRSLRIELAETTRVQDVPEMPDLEDREAPAESLNPVESPVTFESVETQKSPIKEEKLPPVEVSKPAPNEIKSPDSQSLNVRNFEANSPVKQKTVGSRPLVTQPDLAKMTRRERWIGAFIMAAVLAVLGAIMGIVDGFEEWIAPAGWSIIPGAIAGFMSGTNRKVSGVAIVGLAIGVFLFFSWVDNEDGIAIIGGWIGVIAGAITGVILKRRLKW